MACAHMFGLLLYSKDTIVQSEDPLFVRYSKETLMYCVAGRTILATFHMI